jgi:predicted alpha/beta-fold hydrolase
VGYSLGGNVLLKHLGEIGVAVPGLGAAAAVSVPYDLAASAAALERGMGRLYAWHFLRTMIPKAIGRARRFPGTLNARRIRKCRTLREFDDLVTAPVHGFEGANEYYRRCSSRRFLSAVRVPTMLIQALDDPFVPVDSLPSDSEWRNPALRPCFSPRGGHLGFVGHRGPGGIRFWAETTVADFIADRIEGATGGEVREADSTAMATNGRA